MSSRCVEEQSPADHTLARYRAESQEIGEEWHGIRLQVQSVTVANLRVAVPIDCIGKLERYESPKIWTKPLRAFSKHLICERLPYERGQKLV
jgi:hypothetical protein